MDPAVLGIKTFGATLCVREPSDPEYILDVVWLGAQFVRLDNLKGQAWHVERPTAPDPNGQGSFYFIAGCKYPVGPSAIVLRFAASAWTTPFDQSGEYCRDAWPLHLNLRFQDRSGWDHPDSESIVGATVYAVQHYLARIIGLENEQLFSLVQGGWRYATRYADTRSA